MEDEKMGQTEAFENKKLAEIDWAVEI